MTPTQEPVVTPTQEPVVTPTQEPVVTPAPQRTARPRVTPEPEVTEVPEETVEPTMEPAEEPVKYRVTVNYWFEEVGGLPAAPTFTNVYAPGEAYKVISRQYPGYEVDRAEVTGVMGQEDVTFDVIYTAKEYTLTINYIYADGTTAAPSASQQLRPGQIYDVVSPVIDGAFATIEEVEGIMPPWDKTVTVIYVKLPEPAPGRPGRNLFIIEDYETPLGIGQVNLNAGECFE